MAAGKLTTMPLTVGGGKGMCSGENCTRLDGTIIIIARKDEWRKRVGSPILSDNWQRKPA